MPIHARRLDQACDASRPQSRALTAGKQPVVAADGNRPDLVIDPVVVHAQLPVTRELSQRHPAQKAVVQRLGRRADFCQTSSLMSCGLERIFQRQNQGREDATVSVGRCSKALGTTNRAP